MGKGVGDLYLFEAVGTYYLLYMIYIYIGDESIIASDYFVEATFSKKYSTENLHNTYRYFNNKYLVFSVCLH